MEHHENGPSVAHEVIVGGVSVEVLDRPGPADRLLVLVHGYAQDPAELRERVDLFDPAGRFLVALPGAPLRWKGKAIWHRPFSGGENGAEQLLASVNELDALLGRLADETGLAVADSVVGGFSQGGGISMALGYLADVVHRPAATFGICSFPPPVAGLRVDAAAAAARPAFLSIAHADRFATIEMSRHGAEVFEAIGFDLTVVETDGGHELDDDVAAQVGRWIAEVAERPHDRTVAASRRAPIGPLEAFGVTWTVE